MINETEITIQDIPKATDRANRLDALFSAYSAIDDTVTSFDGLLSVLDPNHDDAEMKDLARMKVDLGEMKKRIAAMRTCSVGTIN